MKHSSRYIVLAILAIVIIAAAASAEIESCYGSGDIYYHRALNCCGRTDLSPIDSIEGLFPCTICTDEIYPGHDMPEAFDFGDYIIVRTPDKWMNNRDDIDEVFALPNKDTWYGIEADIAAGDILHGKDYREFLAADEIIFSEHAPGIYCDYQGGEDILSQRHLGDSWYTVLSEQSEPGDVWEGYYRFFGGTIEKKDGLTLLYEPDEWGDMEFRLELIEAKEESVLMSVADNLTTQVYRIGDFNFCLLTTTDEYEYITLRQNGETLLTGAESADSFGRRVLALVLTDAELYLLENGRPIELVHGLCENIDFAGTPYAICYTEDPGWFSYTANIITRDGRELLDRVYSYMYRNGNLFFMNDEDRLLVYDADREDFILSIDEADNKFFRYETSNGSIVIILESPQNSDHYYSIYDLSTGAFLGSVLVPKSPRFFCDYNIENGRPGAFAFWHDQKMYLAGNDGHIISGPYNKLIPLIWSNRKGVYLFAQPAPDQDYIHLPQDFSTGVMALHGFDIRDYDEEGALLGLIDESGTVLAPAEYVYIHVLSENEIELRDQDGETVLIRVP